MKNTTPIDMLNDILDNNRYHIKMCYNIEYYDLSTQTVNL